MEASVQMQLTAWYQGFIIDCWEVCFESWIGRGYKAMTPLDMGVRGFCTVCFPSCVTVSVEHNNTQQSLHYSNCSSADTPAVCCCLWWWYIGGDFITIIADPSNPLQSFVQQPVWSKQHLYYHLTLVSRSFYSGSRLSQCLTLRTYRNANSLVESLFFISVSVSKKMHFLTN